jgi:TRAP-type uncharacterized transport system substrate-binding protein
MGHKFQQVLWQQRKFLIIFIGLLVGIFFSVQLFINFQIINLTIAAGPARSESYQLAQAVAYQLVVCDSKIRLQVLETIGSDRSLELLQTGKVDRLSRS